MIRKENLEAMIKAIGYTQSSHTKVFEKKYTQFDCVIEVDFNGSGSINYPEDKGMKITRKTTCNFSQSENFVVLECITRLMDKGYRPEHIELEKEWTLGHTDKGGFADILVKDADGKTLFIVECKTAGNEYKKELNNTLNDGGQLFLTGNKKELVSGYLFMHLILTVQMFLIQQKLLIVVMMRIS